MTLNIYCKNFLQLDLFTSKLKMSQCNRIQFEKQKQETENSEV